MRNSGKPELRCKLGLSDLRRLKMRNSGKPELRCKLGLPDLRRLKMRNSGKPELRCNPSHRTKRFFFDGCAGRKRVRARP
jgi:hypothetical protein